MADLAVSDTSAKPRALDVLADSISAELTAVPQWVGWRYVWRPPTERKPGKWDKPPVNVRGGPGSSTDPATWSPFAEALAAYQAGDLDGVGIVLYRAEGEVGPGLVGIDLDKCRNPDTGELEPWAAHIVRDLASYTEVSPSGRGVRIFVRGELPAGRRRSGCIEMYATGRYLTVTGHRLDGSRATVENRQAELQALHARIFSPADAPVCANGKAPALSSPKRRGLVARAVGSAAGDGNLSDDDILGLAARSRVGDDFRALMAGDLGRHGNDHSAADLALCDHLAFFCGPDPARIDRLFRRSSLMRPKWNERRGERTYGQLTVAKALEGRTEFYSPTTDGACPAMAGRGGIARLDAYRPFPIDALPNPLGPYVRESAAALGCDAAYLALTVLAAVASLVGNTRVISLKPTWREVCVIWAVIVGDSGTLKSPAWQRALSFLFRLQKRLLKDHSRQRAEYEEAVAKYDEAKRRARKHGGNPGEPPEEPVAQRLVCSDTTIERLAQTLEDNPRGVLLARDELAGWFTSFTRYKGAGGGTDLPNWLEMHRAGTLIVDRKTGDRRTCYIPRAAVSITGGIQPAVLARTLSPEFLDSGLAARMLMAMPPRLPKRWSDTEVDPAVEGAYQAVLEGLLSLSFGTDGDGEKAPEVLVLSPPAKRAWVTFYDRWATVQAAAEGDLAAAFSKLEAYAARFALLHHVVSRVALGLPDLVPVEEESVAAGIRLCQWFAAEARRIYSTLAETAGQRDTRHLVEFIRSHGGKITCRELQRSNSRKYPTSDAAQAALDALAKRGLAEWIDPPTSPKGGQPARFLQLLEAPDATDSTDTCEEEASGASVLSACRRGQDNMEDGENERRDKEEYQSDTYSTDTTPLGDAWEPEDQAEGITI